MPLRDMFLPEFDHEMAGVRKTLERVPDDRLNFKPHDKSSTMQALASHLANIPGWVEVTLKQDDLDFAPPGGEPFKTPQARSTKELLSFFDANLSRARAALAEADDEVFHQQWALKFGGQEIFKMPKMAVLRSFVFNHAIHHRAQLGVYLRLNDKPVPSLYGPSADEQGM